MRPTSMRRTIERATSFKRYCPTHYRSWLVGAHKVMSTPQIFSHLLSRARPIFGANATNDANGTPRDGLLLSDNQGPPSLARKASAPAKRHSALSRAINKKKRKHRHAA